MYQNKPKTAHFAEVDVLNLITSILSKTYYFNYNVCNNNQTLSWG